LETVGTGGDIISGGLSTTSDVVTGAFSTISGFFGGGNLKKTDSGKD
jgi:hypothetical protein